jgi:hypothetical protein
MDVNASRGKPMWPMVVGLFVLVLIFGGLSIDVLHQISKERTGAELTYYRAAVALRAGNDPYAGRNNIYPYVYPPLYAICFEPLTGMSELNAARVMFGLNAGFVLAAIVLGSRAMLRRLRAGTDAGNVLFVSMMVAVIACVPIHNELRGLETNSIILLSFVLALYFLDRMPVLSGLALAVAINIKYLPIIAVPYFLLRRRWTAAISTLVASVVLALLPAITLGWATNLRYLHEAVSGLGHLAGSESGQGAAQVNSTGDLSSLSITSTMARLGTTSQWGKPTQLAIVAAIAGAWLGLILLAYRKRRLAIWNWPPAREQRVVPFNALVAVEWAAMVTFALAFSPNTQNRNLVLAIVPASLAAALICSPLRGAWRALAALAAIGMTIGLVLPIYAMGKPFTVAWLATGGPCWALLATFVILAWAGIFRASVPTKL